MPSDIQDLLKIIAWVVVWIIAALLSSNKKGIIKTIGKQIAKVAGVDEPVQPPPPIATPKLGTANAAIMELSNQIVSDDLEYLTEIVSGLSKKLKTYRTIQRSEINRRKNIEKRIKILEEKFGIE